MDKKYKNEYKPDDFSKTQKNSDRCYFDTKKHPKQDQTGIVEFSKVTIYTLLIEGQ